MKQSVDIEVYKEFWKNKESLIQILSFLIPFVLFYWHNNVDMKDSEKYQDQSQHTYI